YWLDNYYNTDKDTLIINLDNGPENNSRRSQFLKRIADFSVDYDVKVILAYYPPYHSKYNPVERVWGILENHWNGSILDTKETILRFAQSMTYKGLKPTVNLSKNIYECGKKISKNTMKSIESCITRKKDIEKWFVILEPDKIKYTI
ncbi:MAG: ISAzo13-like element transposase-related protein, partial [Paraclostridium sp.]